ncbi:PAS domain-containing sensor histidine kinase [Kaarinaea lacus]
MSLETVDVDNNNDVSTNPNSSALICLQKISEFSHLDESAENNTIINKAIEFIQEITVADHIIVGSLSSDRTKFIMRASYGLETNPENFESCHAGVVLNFCKDRTTFNTKSVGLRQLALSLLRGSPVKSGISIPIIVDSKWYGCLLVFSKKEQIYSESKIIFLEHTTHLISHYLQQKLLFPFAERTARKVVEAKREWEKTIDALPQLVIVLNAHGKIVRVNQAIEHWGLGTVTSLNGKAILNLLTALSPDSGTASHWDAMWQKFALHPFVEWEFENQISGMSLRFSLRHLHKETQHDVNASQQHPGYAVLIVDNITELVQAKKQQMIYTDSLEQQLVDKVEQLEALNDKLAKELEQHKHARKALKVSESRYTHLVENTLVGICVLEEGKIEYCNQRFAEIIGGEVRKFHGKQLLRLVDSKYRAFIFKELNCIMSGQADKYLGVIKATGGDNEGRWIKIKLNHLSAQEPEKILVNIFDVTTQKEIEISLRESEEHLHELYGRLINAQEHERKRVASELHDGLGQMLSSIKYQVENTIKQLDRDKHFHDSNMKVDLYAVVEEIRLAIEETRCMAMDLRPTILDDLGIVLTINWFCRQFQQTYKDLRIHKMIAVEEQDIDEKLKLVIYRVIQESFNNVVKHSNATKVMLNLYKTEHFLNLRIEDNGQGFSFEGEGCKARSGLGLNNMRERAELSGGVFHVDVDQPGGTRINVVWPIVK